MKFNSYIKIIFAVLMLAITAYSAMASDYIWNNPSGTTGWGSDTNLEGCAEFNVSKNITFHGGTPQAESTGAQKIQIRDSSSKTVLATATIAGAVYGAFEFNATTGNLYLLCVYSNGGTLGSSTATITWPLVNSTVGLYFTKGVHYQGSWQNSPASTWRSMTVLLNISDTVAAAPSPSLTVALNTPANNTVATTTNWNLTYNVTYSYNNITDCKLYINGVYNQTNSTAVSNSSVNSFIVPVNTDGVYSWGVNCTGNAANGSANGRVFTRDTTAPTVITNINNSVTNNLTGFWLYSSDTYSPVNFSAIDSCNHTAYNFVFNGSLSINETSALNYSTYARNCTIGQYHTNITSCDNLSNCITPRTEYWNITGQVNITAKSYLTGAYLTSFSVYKNGTLVGTASSNQSLFNISTAGIYNISIQAPGYEHSSAVLNISRGFENYTFYLYTVNSINITIYNENGSLITENVNIKFTQNATEFTNISTGPNFYIDNLTIGTWSLLFSLTDYYVPRTYTVTVSNNSHQFLNVYLTNSSSQTLFTVSDSDTSAVLSDVLATMYKIINGTWVPLESKYTDITGKVLFTYTPYTNYRFYLSKTGYNDNIFLLNPILFSTYDIKMSKSTSAINYSADFDTVSIVYAPSQFNNSVSNTFNWVIAAPSGNLISYGITLTGPGGETNSTIGSNAIGSQLTLKLIPNASTVFDTVKLQYFYETTLAGKRNFTFLLPIILDNSATSYNNTFIDNQNKTFGLGIFERILICTLIILMVVGIATMVGQPIPGLALGLFIFGYMAYIGFIPLWAVLPSMFIGVLFLTWKSGGY